MRELLKKPKGTFSDDAHTLLHPLRFDLINFIAEKPRYVNEIAKALGQKRRLVNHHLEVLEAYGFVTSRRALSKDPQSISRGQPTWRKPDRFFSTCQLLDEATNRLDKGGITSPDAGLIAEIEA